jgi:DNA-binding transcriptional regulator YhcF (GntR family)
MAAAILRQIEEDALSEGEQLGAINRLAREHEVGVGTAYKALELLQTWGAIKTQPGGRAVVLAVPQVVDPPLAPPAPTDESAPSKQERLLDFVVRAAATLSRTSPRRPIPTMRRGSVSCWSLRSAATAATCPSSATSRWRSLTRC